MPELSMPKFLERTKAVLDGHRDFMSRLNEFKQFCADRGVKSLHLTPEDQWPALDEFLKSFEREDA